jgi:hypothetical protein
MTRVLRLVIALALAALPACSSGGEGHEAHLARPADGLDLRASVSPTEVPLLGELELTVDLFVPAGVAPPDFVPVIPDGFAGEVGPARTHDVGAADARGTWTSWTVRLRPTRLGEIEVPSMRVEAGGQVASSAAATVTATSVLAGHGEDAEAPAPPFPAPAAIWPWFAAALALLGSVALFFGLRGRRRQSAPAATPLPPHTRALRALALLRQAPRSTPAEIDRFYVDVSQVLRVYLEERFGLHAPERTTEEFLPEVEASGVLTHDQGRHLRQFLEQCDLVKFARYLPGEDVHTATLQFAVDLVESTRADARRAVEVAAS